MSNLNKIIYGKNPVLVIYKIIISKFNLQKNQKKKTIYTINNVIGNTIRKFISIF